LQSTKEDHPSAQYRLLQQAMIRSGSFKIIEGSKEKLDFSDILDFLNRALDRNGDRILSDILKVFTQLIDEMIGQARMNGERRMASDLIITREHLRQAHETLEAIENSAQ
jgi:hypothetical protein